MLLVIDMLLKVPAEAALGHDCTEAPTAPCTSSARSHRSRPNKNEGAQRAGTTVGVAVTVPVTVGVAVPVPDGVVVPDCDAPVDHEEDGVLVLVADGDAGAGISQQIGRVSPQLRS